MTFADVLSLVALAIALYALYAKWEEKPSLKVFLRKEYFADGPRDERRWRFVHVTVANQPVRRWISWLTCRQTAENTRLELEYYDTGGTNPKFHFDGRWSGNKEPAQNRLVNGNIERVFDPWMIYQGRFRHVISGGSLEDVAVAVKIAGEDDCYGFTNESYDLGVTFWKREDYRLPKGRFIVRATAMCGQVRSKTEEFLLHNDGPSLTDLWLDKPAKDSLSK